nr:hypothetical protein HK105_004966 [Polyrhizophydium stewartii]
MLTEAPIQDLVLSFGDAAGHANRIPFAAGALSYLTTYPHAVDAKFLWRLSSNTDVVQVAWATRTDRSFGHFLNVAAWVHVPPGLDRSKIKVQALITPWIRNSDGSVSRQFGTASAMSFGSKSRDAGWELWVLSPCAGDDKKRAVILDFFVTAEFGDGIVHQARRAYPGGRTVPFRMLEGSQTVQYL